MILSISQLQAATHGAVRLEQTENGTRFWHISEEQRQYYVDHGNEICSKSARLFWRRSPSSQGPWL